MQRLQQYHLWCHNPQWRWLSGWFHCMGPESNGKNIAIMGTAKNIWIAPHAKYGRRITLYIVEVEMGLHLSILFWYSPAFSNCHSWPWRFLDEWLLEHSSKQGRKQQRRDLAGGCKANRVRPKSHHGKSFFSPRWCQHARSSQPQS